MSTPYNIPDGVSVRDLEGLQESDDEATERYFERGDMALDLQDGDVDEPANELKL